MKDAMWKVDPGGGEKFSDVLGGQDVLFQAEVDTRPLQEDLARHFLGQTVSVEILEEYVLVNTPYAATHLTRLTLRPMQIAGRISSPNQARRNTYPGHVDQVRRLIRQQRRCVQWGTRSTPGRRGCGHLPSACDHPTA
jgi:hypothetical protein